MTYLHFRHFFHFDLEKEFVKRFAKPGQSRSSRPQMTANFWNTFKGFLADGMTLRSSCESGVRML
jgi:hypothetical protein